LAIRHLPVAAPIPAHEAAHRPRVSIGVPVYNGERFLERALESLLAQTFDDIEIVISDNASTDGTEAICRRFMARDPRVRYWRSPTNRGLVWNHRRVLAMATGTYFMFAPHDDWFGPDYVARCVEVLDADPEIAYVHAETILVDESGTEIGREIARQRMDDPSPSVRFWDILVVQGGNNWYGLSRRAAFRDLMPYKAVPRGERIVMAELALRGPFRLLPGDHYFRRLHDSQLSAKRVDRHVETRALDPARAGWRSSVPVMLAEYVLAFTEAVSRAPIGLRQKLACYGSIARWVVAHVPGFELTDPRSRGPEVAITGPGRLPVGREHVGY
jgi:glycosyltransferase involved in cell wall biosynthesis